jgi:hypothetical protein
MGTKVKITILKGYLSAYSSVKSDVLLPVEQKEPFVRLFSFH